VEFLYKMARIYLIDAGEIQEGDVNIEYNPHNRIILTPEMRDEKEVLDLTCTPGEMYNIRTMGVKNRKLHLAADFIDYTQHLAHARVGLTNRGLISPEFNAFCTESVDITSDGLLIALRRDKDLPHGPGIYTGAGGYGVHFRGRKDITGRVIPIDRKNPYDLIRFYINRELEVPEDSFQLSWLGMAKCFDLSFDLPVNFTAYMNQSSDDIMKLRRENKRLEGVVLDDMINFIENSPEGILNFLLFSGVPQRKLPLDSCGRRFGENPITGKLGFNDDFIAVILQHIKKNHPESYFPAMAILQKKGYEIIDVKLKEGKSLDLTREILP